MSDRPNSTESDDLLVDGLRRAVGPALRAPVPADLVAVTMRRVRAEAAAASARPTRRPPAWLAAFAAVGLAAAVFAFLVLPRVNPPNTRPSAAPTGAPALANATAAPTAGPTGVETAGPVPSPDPNAPFPTSILGVPVVDVATALAAGAGSGPADAPIAVAGSLDLVIDTTLRCDATAAARPELEQLFRCAVTGQPTLQGSAKPGLPLAVIRDSTSFPAGSVDSRVVIIGHFGDRRAGECSANYRSRCRTAFVVDAIPWVDGHSNAFGAYVETGGDTANVSFDSRTAEALAAKAVPDGAIFAELEGYPKLFAQDDPQFVGAKLPATATIVGVVRMVTAGGFVSVLVDGQQAWLVKEGTVFPTAVGGVQTLTVTQLLEIRDAQLATIGQSQFAVRGWFSAHPVVPCPISPSPPPALVPGCPLGFDTLTILPVKLLHADGSWTGTELPNVNPIFLPADRSFDPRLATPAQPVPVIFVGHFNAAAAAACTTAERAACQQAFVVDWVAWVDGTLKPRTGQP